MASQKESKTTTCEGKFQMITEIRPSQQKLKGILTQEKKWEFYLESENIVRKYMKLEPLWNIECDARMVWPIYILNMHVDPETGARKLVYTKKDLDDQIKDGDIW